MKSLGKRSRFRFTALFKLPVVTPYSRARSRSSNTFSPRKKTILLTIDSIGTTVVILSLYCPHWHWGSVCFAASVRCFGSSTSACLPNPITQLMTSQSPATSMVIRALPGLARGWAGLHASVAKALFLSNLGQFFIRNEYRSKGQRPDLAQVSSLRSQLARPGATSK